VERSQEEEGSLSEELVWLCTHSEEAQGGWNMQGFGFEVRYHIGDVE